MLTTFLDKLGGIFDRRFMIAFWSPVFITLVLGASGGAALLGIDVFPWLSGKEGLKASTLTLLSALLTITVTAYLLQALAMPLVRLYAGYWPSGLARLGRRHKEQMLSALEQDIRAAQIRSERIQRKINKTARRAPLRILKSVHDQAEQERRHARAERFYQYPKATELLRPTRLGNVLIAAEEYPSQVYFLSSALWWPRLWPLLPESFRDQVDAALTPLFALINLTSLFTLLTVVGGSVLIWTDRYGAALLLPLGGVLLVRLSYSAAVSQALSYGDGVRVAFDLYRHKILEQMHIPVPDNLVDERLLWEKLNKWVYEYTPLRSDDAQTFYYDTHKAPAPTTSPASTRVEVTLKGRPRRPPWA